jgi:glycosyltransferase involved in cell wall biosynthesis
MKIDIVIPFHKNEETILNCLRSIKDQDYKRYTITIVVDGVFSKEKSLFFNDLSKKTGIIDYKLIYTGKKSGASYARNLGAKDGNGDVILFLDSDCNLKPGVLRDVVTCFEVVPDIGFVYSNYQFLDTKSVFYSQEYDPYLLESMNYICTMSPIKRDVFNKINGFDEDRKYFQDWGLFYKASKVSKGYYMGKNHIMFSTLSPTDNSISGIKGSLDKKAKEFRKYYGIKDKKMVVTTWGAPLQAIQRAKMLGADYFGIAKGSNRTTFPTNFMFKNWNATYLVGCYNQTLDALSNHLGVLVGNPIIHFIGTDVFDIINSHSIAQLQTIKKMFELKKAKLLVNSKRCQDELKLAGIDAELVYTPIYNMNQYKPTGLPDKFTVAVYCSDSNRMHKFDSQDGYSNVPLLLDVAKSLPMIDFKFFGMDKVIEKKDNIEHCGRIPEEEMPDFIKSCSMIVRSTIHDGFPQLPIQFLLSGRDALVSCPDKELKYADKLSFEDNVEWEKNKSEVINKILEIRGREKSPFRLSQKAHRYYGKLLSVKKYNEEIFKYV